jgi:CRP-like cAMP-binding protein
MTKTSTTALHRPRQNALLAALSTAVCERLTNDLELVPLTLGQVLYESGETMSHAYFPTDGIVSLLYVMKNGESAEIAVVGNEGMVGIGLFMGGESTMSRAVVQNAGHAYRLKAQVTAFQVPCQAS